MTIKTIFAILGFSGVFLAAQTSMATPRQLPFTYPYETLPEGAVELELYGDMTPNRVLRDAAGDETKGRVYEPRYVLQSEFEYGLTDHTELGFYQVFQAEPQNGGDNSLKFDGFKWRVRHRFGEAGKWPVDVAVYVELETMHDEIALEEKLLLSKRWGRFRAMTNLWIEQAIGRPYDAGTKKIDLIVNPTLGAVYELTPRFHPGIEYWMRAYLDTDSDDPIEHQNRRAHHFIGPTAHLALGRLWWTFGAYVNLSNVNNPQPGEVYGPVWFRSVLGLDL